MENFKIAKIFYEIADYLEIKGEPFKPRAYRRAGQILEFLGEDIGETYRKKGVRGLKEIPGIGQSLAEKIEEYLKTKKIKEYEKIKETYPVKISELTAIEGVGPKMVKVFYEKLGVKNINDLKKMAREGKIKKLPRFKEKTEKNILKGIEFLKKSKGRRLLGEILPLSRELEERLKKIIGVKEAITAGSIRRRQETAGDLDILVISAHPKKVMNFFTSMPEVEKIYLQGTTRSSIRLNTGIDADLRIVDPESYGSALQYFTGDKNHNIALRERAKEQGYKLNEYGLFKKGKRIAGKTEKEIYNSLGLQYIDPEIRTNEGEIEAASKNQLPQLIKNNEIKGDLQMHTLYSDGQNTIKEMAEKAQNLNYQYIAITDHIGNLPIASAMNKKRFLEQLKEIDKINKEKKIKILKGAEINIKKDGSLDIEENLLNKLDLVLGAIHDNFKMPKHAMTQRLIKAIKHPKFHILAHPTGRLINQRPPYEIDLDQILKTAKEYHVALEINSDPRRLDLKDAHIKRALQYGIKLSIGTDAHRKDQLENIELGAAQARRGKAQKKDILNAFSLKKLLVWLNP